MTMEKGENSVSASSLVYHGMVVFHITETEGKQEEKVKGKNQTPFSEPIKPYILFYTDVICFSFPLPILLCFPFDQDFSVCMGGLE